MPTERPPLVGEVVPTFADRGYIPEDGTLHSHHCENLKSNSEYYFLSKSYNKDHEIRFSQDTDYFTVFLSLLLG
jgi:hypothetical protein